MFFVSREDTMFDFVDAIKDLINISSSSRFASWVWPAWQNLLRLVDELDFTQISEFQHVPGVPTYKIGQGKIDLQSGLKTLLNLAERQCHKVWRKREHNKVVMAKVLNQAEANKFTAISKDAWRLVFTLCIDAVDRHHSNAPGKPLPQYLKKSYRRMLKSMMHHADNMHAIDIAIATRAMGCFVFKVRNQINIFQT